MSADRGPARGAAARWPSRGVRVLLTLALLVGTLWLVARLVPGAMQRLHTARPGWLALVSGLQLCACAAYAALFRGLFGPPLLGGIFGSPGRPGPARRFGFIGLAELGAYAVLPSGAGGAAVRVWALRAQHMSLRVIGERSVTFAVIFNGPYVLVAACSGWARWLTHCPAAPPSR